MLVADQQTSGMRDHQTDKADRTNNGDHNRCHTGDSSNQYCAGTFDRNTQRCRGFSAKGERIKVADITEAQRNTDQSGRNS